MAMPEHEARNLFASEVPLQVVPSDENDVQQREALMDTDSERSSRPIAPSSGEPPQESVSSTMSSPPLPQAGHRLYRWVDERTLPAPWMPCSLSRHLIGYLMGALLVVALFIALSFLLIHLSDLPLATLLILL